MKLYVEFKDKKPLIIYFYEKIFFDENGHQEFRNDLTGLKVKDETQYHIIGNSSHYLVRGKDIKFIQLLDE